jgi:EmrB/QacA subfamily drug resistance transporter
MRPLNPFTQEGAATAPERADLTVHDARLRRSILLTVCIALMAVIAAVTGLNVAQPHLARDLHATQADVLWIINTYTISLAALLLPLGAAGDRLGRKPVLLAGLLMFGMANVLSALAPSTSVMLVARLLGGVGAAFIMPVTLSVITSVFPAQERSKAIGVLGMFLSAVLVDLLSWRWLFALPVVLVIVAAFMAVHYLPNARERFTHALDVVGSLLSIVAMMGLIIFLHEGPRLGWTASGVIVSLLIGLVATAVFVGWELRQPAPILDIRLFRKRGLSSGSVALLAWFGVQSGVFIVLYPYFQAVLGWSGLRATVALMPMALLMMALSSIAPSLARHIGPKRTLATGILVGGAGLALMAALVSVEGGYRSVLPGMVAMGIGMGLAMAPATEAITSSLPREQQGVASAVNDVTREFGTALGVALLGAVFAAGYSNAVGRSLAGVPADVAALAGRGIAYAQDMASAAGPFSALVYRSAQEAFIQGWKQSMWAGVVVMSLLFAFVVVRGVEQESETYP